MDTSLSKALIMVAGVLLAMIVIAFVTFSFRRIGTWATTSDEQELSEQKEKFNKEYEVYDKNLMYGVDVISCLNKAKSNNDKISSTYAEKVDASYEIKVRVELTPSSGNKANLDESLTVYHIVKEDDEREIAYTTGNGPNVGNIKINNPNLGFKFLNTNYSNLSTSITSNANNFICSIQNTVKVDSTLELTKDTPENSDIMKLLDASDAISQVVKNSDYNSRNNPEGWTKVEFKSALYALKQKKFKCTGITYKESGRVDTISFKEY